MPPGTWDSGAGATVTCRNPCIFWLSTQSWLLEARWPEGVRSEGNKIQLRPRPLVRVMWLMTSTLKDPKVISISEPPRRHNPPGLSSSTLSWALSPPPVSPLPLHAQHT